MRRGKQLQFFLKKASNDGKLMRDLEGGEGIGGDVKGGHLHVVEEIVEMIWLEDDLGERLVADALPQHDAAVQRYLGCLVPLNTRVF